jgi:hypothetical protein
VSGKGRPPWVFRIGFLDAQTGVASRGTWFLEIKMIKISGCWPRDLKKIFPRLRREAVIRNQIPYIKREGKSMSKKKKVLPGLILFFFFTLGFTQPSPADLKEQGKAVEAAMNWLALVDR